MSVVLLAALVALGAAAVAVGYRHYVRTPAYLLTHGDAAQRRWAIRELLRSAPSPRQWERIVCLLDDPDTGVQLAVVAALAKGKHPDAVRLLGAVTGSGRDLGVRLRALEGLCQCGTDAAWDAVTRTLSSPEPECRALAATCLGRAARKGAARALAGLLGDASPSVREAAVAALRELTADPTRAVPAGMTWDKGRLVWEAERGINVQGNFEIAPSPRERAALPQRAAADPLFRGLDGASGAGWIRCLEGAGGNHEWLGGEAGSIDIGQIEYPILIVRPGRYRLWARMWFMDKCSDSYYAWFDRQAKRLMDHPYEHVPEDEWRVWYWLPDRQEEGVFLEAGIHSLHIQAREDGVRFDQFCLLPDGAEPPPRHAALAVNYDPAILAGDTVQLAISRESEVVSADGRLFVAVHLLRGGEAPLRGTLTLTAADGVVDGPTAVTVEFPEPGRTLVQEWTVAFPSAAPSGERVIAAGFVPADGGEAVAGRLIVSKPWSWQIAGPLSAPNDAAALAADGGLNWRALDAGAAFNRYGTMDFEKLFGNGTGGWVYLKTRIRCAETAEYLWLLNSDDNAVVWLDGREVVRNARNAPAEGFLTRGRGTVSAGEHTLTAMVQQADFPDGHLYESTQNYWLFRLRIRRDDHVPAPITGL